MAASDRSESPRRLSLLRHAKAGGDAPNDFARPLAPRGLRDAPQTGHRIAGWSEPPGLIVASDALRAKQTAEAVGAAFDTPPPIVFERELYLAETTRILATVQALASAEQHVMLVGHNPGFTDFCNRFADAGIGNLPTCGVVRTRIWVPEWTDAGWGCASVECIDTPKKPAG